MFILSYLFSICLFITSFNYSITFDLTNIPSFNFTLDPAIQYAHLKESLLNLFYETSSNNLAYTNQFIICNSLRFWMHHEILSFGYPKVISNTVELFLSFSVIF